MSFSRASAVCGGWRAPCGESSPSCDSLRVPAASAASPAPRQSAPPEISGRQCWYDAHGTCPAYFHLQTTTTSSVYMLGASYTTHSVQTLIQVSLCNNKCSTVEPRSYGTLGKSKGVRKSEISVTLKSSAYLFCTFSMMCSCDHYGA